MGTDKRGFASMDKEKQREIARKGGQAAHTAGRAHEFDSAEAKAAGSKGGKSVARNLAHMAAIGRKGGQKSAASRKKATPAQEAAQETATEAEVS
jgi:general stress protein YciG